MEEDHSKLDIERSTYTDDEKNPNLQLKIVVNDEDTTDKIWRSNSSSFLINSFQIKDNELMCWNLIIYIHVYVSLNERAI